MIWYPYQQMKHLPKPYRVTDAEGPYLYVEDEPLLDSVSSWWCALYGHHQPELTAALKEQADRFSHVMLAGLVHEPVERLSDKLASWLPGTLDYCFFSDSGSVGVEVALKMAWQYYTNRGERTRTIVLALKNAYHGDTLRAMQVSDDEDYHAGFPRDPQVLHIPTTIAALEQAFAEHGRQLNAMIVEPVLQGAGGFRIYSVDFLRRARELCDQYDVLLIFDEVATGFGRTGYRFISDLVQPDILVLGKALTGGMMGHAVTVANEKVYQGFYDDDPAHAFMHGPTFMANPLACSVALKAIELFDRDHYLDKIHHLESLAKQELADFHDERIREIRILGGCICIETTSPDVLQGYADFARAHGVFARPFLTYLYAMFPFILTDEQLRQITTTMKDWFRRG